MAALLVVSGFVLTMFTSHASDDAQSTSASAPIANDEAAATPESDESTSQPSLTNRSTATESPVDRMARKLDQMDRNDEAFKRAQQHDKAVFLTGVDETITASQIAGNPDKYVGTDVDLHCTVSNIPQEGTVNALCGDDDANIVLLYDDTNSLDKDQSIRVLGTVDDPAEGTNAFGGSMRFPTVKVSFME